MLGVLKIVKRPYTVKKGKRFSVPSRDVTNQHTLAGSNLIILDKLFLQCIPLTLQQKRQSEFTHCLVCVSKR